MAEAALQQARLHEVQRATKAEEERRRLERESEAEAQRKQVQDAAIIKANELTTAAAREWQDFYGKIMV